MRHVIWEISDPLARARCLHGRRENVESMIDRLINHWIEFHDTFYIEFINTELSEYPAYVTGQISLF